MRRMTNNFVTFLPDYLYIILRHIVISPVKDISKTKDGYKMKNINGRDLTEVDYEDERANEYFRTHKSVAARVSRRHGK